MEYCSNGSIYEYILKNDYLKEIESKKFYS